MNSGSPPDLPLVSIGVSCYNAEDSIGRAVASAVGQDWPNFEIVVVDDGSSDRSWEIIEDAAKQDTRIQIIRHPENRGYAGALNTIIENSSGEYIAIFDDDDDSEPDRISKQWRRLISYVTTHNTDMVFCYSNRDVVEIDHDRNTTVYAIGRKPVEPSGEAVADFLLWHHQRAENVWGQFGSCTLFVSKQTLTAAGPLDESFRRCAEWDLAIRHAFTGGHFIAVDESLITQHKTITGDKSGRIPLIYALKLRKKYKSYLKKKKVYLASIAIAHARFHYSNRRQFLSRFYLALACLSSPKTVLPSELANRKRSRRSAA
jgi:glycosyltransferase involved in cell wall biosynthesis